MSKWVPKYLLNVDFFPMEQKIPGRLVQETKNAFLSMKLMFVSNGKNI